MSIDDIPERDTFEIFSIRVVHHLADPDAAVASLIRATRPGGIVLVWLYGRENNGWIIWLFMPLRMVHHLSLPLTAVLWVALRSGISRRPYLRLIRGSASDTSARSCSTT